MWWQWKWLEADDEDAAYDDEDDGGGDDHPWAIFFFGIHTILHDILGFDTIYHTIFAIFWKVKFGKKFTWNSRQMRKINMKAFLDA